MWGTNTWVMAAGEKEAGQILKEVLAENVLNLLKITKLHIQMSNGL